MNELKNLDQFKSLLEKYTVSDHVKEVLSNTQLLLLAGVTSSGRNTVVNELLKTNKYHFIVSDTTRKPRINHGQIEENGREYWFKSEEEFLGGLKNGEYVEAAIIHDQQVSGISIHEIELASEEGRIAVTDIEVVGVGSIVKAKPDTISVFMIPPDFREWLKRINGRSNMSDKELKRRLKSAINELRVALSKDCCVIIVNDEFHQTADMIKSIFEVVPDQKQPRQVAEKLLMDTENYLKLS